MFEAITLQLPKLPNNMEMQGRRTVRDKQFRQELGAKGKSVIECMGGSFVLQSLHTGPEQLEGG